MKFSLIAVFADYSKNIKGNISAVVLLNEALSDEKMQAIAADFNQPATTFLWKAESENEFNIRWFAPDSEIGLCGHGTMAATAFLSKGEGDKNFTFYYKKGTVGGKTNPQGLCTIELGAIPTKERLEIPQVLKDGLGINIIEYYSSDDKYIVVAENREAVKNMKPDFHTLRKSDVFGYAVTAKGDNCDFVSRTLVPHVQQLEDPATGSSHAVLTPFWANRLNKNKLQALQLSKRGGSFLCELEDDKVKISSDYKIIAEGELKI
jgi:PhzF family phenazine biosynthesis protein